MKSQRIKTVWRVMAVQNLARLDVSLIDTVIPKATSLAWLNTIIGYQK